MRSARIVNMPPDSRLAYKATGMTFSIAFMSFFPQYCEIIIPEPAVIPAINRLSTNCICPASEAADNEVWSTNPNITASVALTSANINCCIAIGTTSLTSFSDKSSFFLLLKNINQALLTYMNQLNLLQFT